MTVGERIAVCSHSVVEFSIGKGVRGIDIKWGRERRKRSERKFTCVLDKEGENERAIERERGERKD